VGGPVIFVGMAKPASPEVVRFSAHFLVTWIEQIELSMWTSEETWQHLSFAWHPFNWDILIAAFFVPCSFFSGCLIFKTSSLSIDSHHPQCVSFTSQMQQCLPSFNSCEGPPNPYACRSQAS
jgi:hypothetical protein